MSSQDDDDDDDQLNCPICFEKFKNPKLLPCRHTFCKACLNVYSEQKQATENEKVFPCPMCRSKCKIPKGGIQNLLTNFFVDDKIVSTGHVCFKCGDRLPSEDAQCRRCISAQMQSAGADQSENEESRDHYGDIPLSFLMHFPLAQIRTKFKVKLLSTLNLSEGDSHEREKVTALGPTHDNMCWVVLDCLPDLYKINSSGEKIKHLFVEPPIVIFDVSCRRDGAVLLLTQESTTSFGIWKMDEETGVIKTMSIFKNFRGHDMTLFSDERIAVAGTITLPPNESGEIISYGKVMILSREGSMIRTLGNPGNKLNISCLTINPKNDLICWTDPKSQCVEVLFESGIIVGRCSGRAPLFPILNRSSNFRPVGICCDKNGYIIVCDQMSNILHVLTPTGTFCGILTTESPELFENPFGNPYLVACSSSGDLWVGDGNTAEVKIYSITNYKNTLDRFPF